VMQDGKAYSFHELIALIPHVPVSILSELCKAMARKGKLWGGYNGARYIKTAERIDAAPTSAFSQWPELKGYDATLRSAIREPVSRRP